MRSTEFRKDPLEPPATLLATKVDEWGLLLPRHRAVTAAIMDNLYGVFLGYGWGAGTKNESCEWELKLGYFSYITTKPNQIPSNDYRRSHFATTIMKNTLMSPVQIKMDELFKATAIAGYCFKASTHLTFNEICCDETTARLPIWGFPLNHMYVAAKSGDNESETLTNWVDMVASPAKHMFAQIVLEVFELAKQQYPEAF